MVPDDLETYRYPDEGDRITLTLIGQRDVPPALWEQEESTVLERIDAVLRTGPLETLLDYGSGGGRLAVRYAEMFGSVTSFEPDQSRAQQQRDLVAATRLPDPPRPALDPLRPARQTPPAARIQVLGSRDGVAGQYDVVLCSHVIQHVPGPVAEGVIRDVSTLVAPGGFVVMTTTLSPRSTPVFVLNYVTEDGRAVEDEVSVGEFEATLRSGKMGVLPIRFFPFDDLVADCERWGMDLVSAFGFHGDVGVVGPVVATSPELLRCRDLAVVTRRR